MVIVARGLTRQYDGGVRALNAVDVEVPEGEFVAVTVPSGCGQARHPDLECSSAR